MSVVDLEKPGQEANVTTLERPRTVARPATRTRKAKKTQVRLNVRIEERTSAQPKAGFMMATMAFVGIFTVTYATSSLMGQVRVEKARRLEIAARERAREARRTEASLRARVDSLTSAASIESWAKTHGFVVPKAEGETEEMTTGNPSARAGYVAQR